MSGTLIVSGRGSKIIQELEKIVPGPVVAHRDIDNTYPEPFRYCFAQGMMTGQPFEQMDAEDEYSVNTSAVAKLCEWVLENDINARICVIGSAPSPTPSSASR